MPARRLASVDQRALFEKLDGVPFVLSAKPADNLWSVNFHGTLVLYDKDWTGKVKDDPRETLVALQDKNGHTPLTSSGEPQVHLHVDWTKINWARLESQDLELIGTNRAVVFHSVKECTGRIFSLYCLDKNIDTMMVLNEWVKLTTSGGDQ